MPETWVEIPEKPGYEISDHGRVRSWRQGPVRPIKLVKNTARGGYLQFRLGAVSRNYKAHVEVLRLFVGPRLEGHDGRHLDGNVDNNHLSNLAYGTRSQNMADTIGHGRHNNASKTHCKRDHEFTPENTRVDPKRGIRYCKECGRIAARASYARIGRADRR
jgi:hypothetical protein